MGKTILSDGSSKFDGGGFSVTIQPDGGVSVKPGDSLSKYSMAIYGDFNHLGEFKHRRHNPSGPITDADLASIPNVNVINVGEILYHIPSRGNSATQPTEPSMPTDPKVFSPENLCGMRHDYFAKIWFAAYGQYLVAGQSWLAADGRRTIISINTGAAAIIYLLENPANRFHGKLIIQNGEDFMRDVRNWMSEHLGQRLQPLKQVVEFEVALILGLVSCANSPMLGLVTGVSCLEWVVNNRSWLVKVNEAIRITYKVRGLLIQHCPVLYEKLLNGFYHSLIRTVPNIIGNVPEAIINDPKACGSATGVIIGKLTMLVLNRRFAINEMINIILDTIAVKAVMALPGAVVLTFAEKENYAREIVNQIRQGGGNITDAEAKVIIDEILANPQLVKDSINQLNQAFAAIL